MRFTATLNKNEIKTKFLLIIKHFYSVSFGLMFYYILAHYKNKIYIEMKKEKTTTNNFISLLNGHNKTIISRSPGFLVYNIYENKIVDTCT